VLLVVVAVAMACVAAQGKVVHVEEPHRRSMLANGLGSAPPMGWVSFGSTEHHLFLPFVPCCVFFGTLFEHQAHLRARADPSLIPDRRWNSWNHFQCDGNGEVVIRETGN
jgi:alpha-galactosidase